MTANPTGDRSSLDGALRWIGDLDHPFYNDERQRFIWYEASAIGLQLTVMLQFLVCGVLMIAMGRGAFPFLAVGLLPMMVATTLATLYAHRHGAPYFVKASELRTSRAIFSLLVVAVFAIGGLRVGFQSETGGGVDFDPSAIAGAITGGLSVLVVGYFLKRKLARGEAELDANDL